MKDAPHVEPKLAEQATAEAKQQFDTNVCREVVWAAISLQLADKPEGLDYTEADLKPYINSPIQVKFDNGTINIKRHVAKIEIDGA